jgi:nucleoside-diphosphate-sugar epimerase
METVCLRYFNVFGPRQNPASKYAAVVPGFIRLLLQGKTLTLEGDGTQSRDFTYVENVVQANIKALHAPGVSGEVFNVACGERFDLNFLILELGQIIGVAPEVVRVAARPGDVPHSLADISRARELLGYEPEVGFREGLRRTVEWFRTEGDRHFAV